MHYAIGTRTGEVQYRNTWGESRSLADHLCSVAHETVFVFDMDGELIYISTWADFGE